MERSKPDQAWVELCALDEVPEPANGGKYIVHANRSLAVFRCGDDAVCVLNDTCPHAGGSLSAGHVQGQCITCPWHGWTFDVHTGVCPDNSSIRAGSYLTRVVRGRVEALLDIV